MPARQLQAHTFLAPSEKEKLRRCAASMGLSQSAFIRKLIVEAREPWIGMEDPWVREQNEGVA